ncbi:BCCT family transporter [Paraclostridium bifermentans]
MDRKVIDNEVNDISRKPKIRKSIFIPMIVIFLSIIIVGIISPKDLYNIQNYVVGIAFDNFGWLFQLSAISFVIICVWLMFSKYGSIKLGGKDSKPTLTYWNWFTISLTSGIGTGILFWGIAEPITHFMNPPHVGVNIEGGGEVAAMLAMNISYTHWTFIPYAIYAVSGVMIAFAVYNMNLPCRVSSVLYTLRNRRVSKVTESIIDNICLFAICGGVASCLGVGTMQIGKGLEQVLDIPNTKITWLFIVGLIVVIYIISSVTGIEKGVKWIADKNTKLYIILLGFVFIVGPTTFILSLGTQSLGYTLDNLLQVSTYLSPIDKSDWPRWWSVYYWAIWLAYAPIMGMFFALISKGRTIKEFMIMNFIVPSIFGVIWFIVFGGASIYQQINGIDLWGTMNSLGTEASLFLFIKAYPFSSVIAMLFIVGIFISIVTMCDTMTTTISNLSINSEKYQDNKIPWNIKVFWGVSMALIAIVNLLSSNEGISGIDATKQLATVTGFPILFIMIILVFCGIKMIINNKEYDENSK